MKYRSLLVNKECFPFMEGCNIILTYVIQVKKWYGWVTIKTIEGLSDIVYKSVENLLTLLNQSDYYGNTTEEIN